MFNQIIIIGGGNSIKEGEMLGLYTNLKGCLVIGCNYAYKYFKTTCNAFVDIDFYEKNKHSLQDRVCAGHFSNVGELDRFPEVKWLKHSKEYSRLSDSKAVYNPILVGIWAISLAIYLMKNEGNIYLLGYDWTKKGEGNTHFYQGIINHQGINKTSFYDEQNPDRWFKPFLQEKGVNIYNVNPKSNINCFDKIPYPELFRKIEAEPYSQDYLKRYINAKLDLIRIKQSQRSS